jgi:hypothetical protein
MAKCFRLVRRSMSIARPDQTTETAVIRIPNQTDSETGMKAGQHQRYYPAVCNHDGFVMQST